MKTTIAEFFMYDELRNRLNNFLKIQTQIFSDNFKPIQIIEFRLYQL
jgi:hypothetical protein